MSAHNIHSEGFGGLFVVGVDHHAAPLEAREKLHTPPEQLASALASLATVAEPHEAVILSTCNRFEVYGTGSPNLARDWIIDRGGESVEPLLTTIRGIDAIRHLFSIAGSIESQIVGETQILGQVKTAYETAYGANLTCALFNVLFQTALSVGKRVRNETRIAETPVSTSSVAVRLFEKIFTGLAGRRVVVIGAGEMARLAAEHLKDRGAVITIVSTRRHSSAEKLANDLSADAVTYDQLEKYLALADGVICGSNAPHVMVTVAHVHSAQTLRRNRPLFLVDLAIPRDVEPAAGDIENVFLYNIDDLEGIAAEHRKEREMEIPKARAIIDEETALFWERHELCAHDEALKNLHSHITSVVAQELSRAGVSPDAADALKKSIPNRVLSEAFKRSRAAGHAERRTLSAALRNFFGL